MDPGHVKVRLSGAAPRRGADHRAPPSTPSGNLDDRAGYATSPLDDQTLAGYQLVALDLTALTAEAVAEFGLGRKAVGRTRNMLALGLVELALRPRPGAHAGLAR